MQVRLLGPVDVVAGGRPQVVGGLRRTGVLAVLALAAGEVVSADDLTEAVWGGEPPASNSLQSHISALRGVLGRDAIVARPPGYVLELGPDGTDVQAAGRLLRPAAATAGPAQAVADLRAALDLWRGTPLTGVRAWPACPAWPARPGGWRSCGRRSGGQPRLARGQRRAPR